MSTNKTKNQATLPAYNEDCQQQIDGNIIDLPEIEFQFPNFDFALLEEESLFKPPEKNDIIHSLSELEYCNIMSLTVQWPTP